MTRHLQLECSEVDDDFRAELSGLFEPSKKRIKNNDNNDSQVATEYDGGKSLIIFFIIFN